ncbi:deaminase domain-containing protein [Brenneria goodwinii]
MAAELAGIIINDNLVKTEGWQEQQAQISRVAGAFAGALATGKTSGVNSGANAAEIVERFNRQLHLDELQAIKELAKGDKEKEERLLAASCRKVNCVAQESLSSAERQRYEALMKKHPATRTEDGLLANYWVQKERQRTGNYPLYAGYDMQQLFTYTAGDSISDSQLFARNQWVENASKITGWSKESVETLGITVSIASTFAGMGKANVGNQYLSTKLVAPAAGWKSYLVNEKTIQQAAVFKKQVIDLRAGLPSAPKRSGNVAVAQIDIQGMPKTLASHNHIDQAGKGFVGEGSQNFKFDTIPTADGRSLERNIDSEYKILDNLADKLGANTSVKGSVTIFTEKPACGSCLGVIEQFQRKYPSIKVDVLDNNGVLLKPGGEK